MPAIASTSNEIIKEINKRIEETLNLLEKSLSSGNKFISEDILNFNRESDSLKQAKNLLDYLKKLNPEELEIPDAEALKIELKIKIDALHKTASKADLISDSRIIKEILDKLQIVAQIDSGFKSYYDKEIERLSSKQQSILNESDENQNFYVRFSKIQHISSEYKKFAPNLQQETDKIRSKKIQDLENLVEKTGEICKTKIKEETSSVLKNIFTSIREQRNWNLESGSTLDNDLFFEKIFEGSLQHLTSKADEIKRRIEKLFESADQGEVFAEVEDPFSELYYLKMSDNDVGSRISPQFFMIYEKIRSGVKDIIEKFINIFELERYDKLTYKYLVKVLDSTNWLKKSVMGPILVSAL